jgi:hypothetical protein
VARRRGLVVPSLVADVRQLETAEARVDLSGVLSMNGERVRERVVREKR